MSPGTPRIEVVEGVSALARRGAELFVAAAAGAIAARGRFFVALAGGATPRPTYTLLADPGAPYRDRVDWPRLEVFFGDERCVDPDHPESNYRTAREALLSRVPLAAGNVHRMRGELPPEEAARRYEDELRRVFGLSAGDRPRFDLILLGMGADGHTASLFPGTSALVETRRLVCATYVEKLGAYRLTLTLPVLDNARALVFLIAGADKSASLARVLRDEPDPSVPAARVRPMAGSLTWVLDAETVELDRADRGG